MPSATLCSPDLSPALSLGTLLVPPWPLGRLSFSAFLRPGAWPSCWAALRQPCPLRHLCLLLEGSHVHHPWKAGELTPQPRAGEPCSLDSHMVT